MPELYKGICKLVSKEFDEYMKSECMLEARNPDELAGFSNKLFMEEVRIFCPVWFHCALGASGVSQDALKVCGPEVNSLGLATATIARVRNAKASAAHYRISTILFHSGVKHDDLTRLNRLGLCMSPDSIVTMQKKMNEQLEGKLQLWKEQIVENRSALMLAREVLQKQIATPLDVSEQTLRLYEFYSATGYKALKAMLVVEKERAGRDVYTTDCLQAVVGTLATYPFFLLLFRLVGDNIDYEIQARVQSQQHKNRSIHWTHQFAVLDRVQDPNLDSQRSQKKVGDIQLAEILPDRIVQTRLVRNWAVIVSRVITKYLPPFQSFQDVVVRHIPHKYSKEMSQQSDSCFLGMQFLNPNVAGDMAQLLQHNQEKYVPCLINENKKKILAQIPLHGDQLFEERARNVIWTYRDGIDGYERLEGINTEFADWHAKFTLYKTEFKMFVNHSSAAEVGTSMVSINRTGKTNASKGVENHYNEYSEFHARETEAHICASFMEMTGMNKITGNPEILLFPQKIRPG
ncbi:uncharacterized protein LOC110050397 [Orbicella faveolata]|uniref:uncharacterized protein LOC110050397 n=1 Tax=Orbicella faveolata TaxID=48498 RepID=UPI0009E5714A|nr:uncharacterized protein LOC110050397 [Orbicella faveolata]